MEMCKDYVPCFMFCRVCLSTGRKFYDLEKYKLLESFEQMSGIFINSETRLPRSLCTECCHRLFNYAEFCRKSRKAQSLLVDLLTACDQVTEESIRSLKSGENDFNSLSQKNFAPNHYDLLIDYSDVKENAEPLSLQEVNIEMDIKDEEDFGNKSIDGSIKSEISDDRPVSTSVIKKDKKRTRRKLVTKKLSLQTKIDRRRKLVGDDLDDKIISSTILSDGEQLTEFQKRCESSSYKNAVFRCKNCFKGFLDEEAYRNHMVRHTDQCGVYECEICKIHFKKAHALRNHITSHTHKYSCKSCPYVTSRKQTAKLHEEWHNGTRYQCPHCKEEFLKFTTYMGHIRIKHPSDCVCQLCGYSFVSEKGLRLHRKLKHRLADENEIPSDGPYCELCDVRFISQEALRRHTQVSSRHTEAGNDTKNASHLRRQRKQRDDKDSDIPTQDEERRRKRTNGKPEGPIPCEQCNIQLEDSRAYYKHFRRVHPDKNRTNYPSMKSPCMCEVCGRMFQTLALLQDHSWVHTDEKRFKCDLCNKSFQQKQRLVAHRHIHSQQRTAYECDVCGKSFTTHSNRQRHMFSHTGLKPYKCEMCGKCFKHASEKRAHVTYVHLKKPWPKRARGKRNKDGCDPETHLLHREIQSDLIEPLWAPCADPKINYLRHTHVLNSAT